MDWTGLWTGLDCCIQTANTTKATTATACPQLCLKLLPCCWVLEAASSRFPIGQRSHAYLMSFNKDSSAWLLVVETQLLVGSVNGFEHPWLVSTDFLWRPHASVGEAPSSIFDWALVRMLCLLDLEGQLFCTETTLQPYWSVENRRNFPLSHSWSSFLLNKYEHDLWPRRNRGADASTGLEATWDRAGDKLL